jgi:uncharacterized protein (TIGR03083 family)
MKSLQPIHVTHLFSPLLDSLLALLAELSPADWEQPTACDSWPVKRVVQHLLGGEIGMLSRRRDEYRPPGGPNINAWAELVAFINTLNETWINATDRISPTVLIDLLRLTGPQVCAYFQALDEMALGGPVSWAGPDPAPVWLDMAREYTERWHHQQHIRDAVGRPGMTEARFFAPVLDAFVRAWPYTYRDTRATEGTIISLTIEGEAGNQWFLVRQGEAWTLYQSVADQPQAAVVIPQETAWRLFTHGLSQAEAQQQTRISGDQSLGTKVLTMVSIIA